MEYNLNEMKNLNLRKGFFISFTWKAHLNLSFYLFMNVGYDTYHATPQHDKNAISGFKFIYLSSNITTLFQSF
ncbi:MAG: hypothetical protein LBG15_05210 [Dysgonamonadaceae bacterium]|nr:hypothetical protein [Dysgonamonadaceae bacterium]